MIVLSLHFPKNINGQIECKINQNKKFIIFFYLIFKLINWFYNILNQ